MLKYVETEITFSELPDEITLCINLSNCPNNCQGCHSPHLQTDIGKELTVEELFRLLSENEGITAVCFMGGESDIISLNELAAYVRLIYFPSTGKRIKVGVYFGCNGLPKNLHLKFYDYVKLGEYIEFLGGLDNKNTNQRLHEYSDLYSDCTIGKGWKDITYKFHKNV